MDAANTSSHSYTIGSGISGPYNAPLARAPVHDDRTIRRRLTRLEEIVLELVAASRPSLVPRPDGQRTGTELGGRVFGAARERAMGGMWHGAEAPSPAEPRGPRPCLAEWNSSSSGCPTFAAAADALRRPGRWRRGHPLGVRLE